MAECRLILNLRGPKRATILKRCKRSYFRSFLDGIGADVKLATLLVDMRNAKNAVLDDRTYGKRVRRLNRSANSSSRVLPPGWG
jgi:hypothetical protein